MTIKEIAELAGVSISTVSKIVNNKDKNINPDTRERVLKIVKEYHYTPYGTAKANSNSKTFIIGILLPSIERQSTFLNGIHSFAQKHGYSTIVYDSHYDKDLELKHITALCNHHIDGVIWHPVCEESLSYEKHFLNQNVEICYMNEPFSNAFYHIDYETLGYEATKTLLTYHHTNLGCFIYPDTVRSEQVLAGFKKCLYDNQIPFQDTMMLTPEQTVCHRFLSATPFTGFVSSHYDLALAFVQSLQQMNYQIPTDFSIVTLREDDIYTSSFPKIPNIPIPFFDFGSFLCRCLLNKLHKKTEELSKFHSNPIIEHKEFLDVPPSSKQKKIVVVGSINMDITLNVPSLPQAGKTLITDRFSTMPGGKGTNQSAGVVKLGGNVALIGKVGNDQEASIIYDYLLDNHILTQGVSRDSHLNTGKAFIHVQADGDSTITILTGANQALSPKDIELNERIFEHSAYCLLQTEVPTDAIIRASQLAHRYHAKTILKPAGITSITSELLKDIDIFVPNEQEANLLCPLAGSLEEKADYFLSLGAKTVIITLGKQGCYLKTPSLSKKYPVSDFPPADCTGASDSFIATLAVYLQQGKSLDVAIQIATISAGFCISRQGVLPSLVDRNTLETYIHNFYPELLLSEQQR